MNKHVKKGLKIFATLVVALLFIVIGYVAYVFISYSRIEDNKELSVTGKAKEACAKVDTEYTIVSQNIGFGAYTADFTFFMDGGKESRAKSADSVKQCTAKAIETIGEKNPDIILFQEVDTDSTRSHHVNQSDILSQVYTDYNEVYAVNYHSAYLFYPIFEPHGASNSGIDTYSNMTIKSALRRKLKVSSDFSKILDLDRCYSISRIDTDNDKELVVFNVHLSAYGADASVRESQYKQLFADMEKEVKAGNYVVCGGDFNADFTGTSVKALNGADYETDLGWTKPFPDELIPAGIGKCVDYTCGKELQSVRDCDIPYKEGNFTMIVDGFLVSSNVEVTYLENIQTGFEYSDHNPVCMKFILK